MAPLETIEDYELMTHFVTFTLHPNMYGHIARQQLRKTIQKLEKELRRVCKHYVIVAELTKQCNIHYHGLIQFDINEFFEADDLRLMLLDNLKIVKEFGRCDIDPIKDMTKVFDYCKKDIKKTENILNPRGKTKIDIIKEWNKQHIIPSVPVKQLKKYLTIDDIEDDTQYNEEFIIGMDGLLKRIFVKK